MPPADEALWRSEFPAFKAIPTSIHGGFHSLVMLISQVFDSLAVSRESRLPLKRGYLF
jgi:hypothetical protein